LIRRLIEKSERGFRIGVNSHENLNIDTSRAILDLLKVCDYMMHNYDEFDNAEQISDYDLRVGEIEDLVNTIHISSRIPDSIILEILSNVSENISIHFLKENIYKHYPKLISNLIAEINLKELSARGEMRNLSTKIAELYYYIESKLNEKREVNYWFTKRIKYVLKKDDRFLHRVEFLKLALVRQSIFTYLEETDTSEKYRRELFEIEGSIKKDIISYLKEKTFTLNKRPASPVSSIYYHFTNAYNDVPISVISEFSDILKKYKFYGLTPSDFQVKITESYDSDGLVENIIYDFRIEEEVMNGFSKKIDILLLST